MTDITVIPQLELIDKHAFPQSINDPVADPERIAHSLCDIFKTTDDMFDKNSFFEASISPCKSFIFYPRWWKSIIMDENLMFLRDAAPYHLVTESIPVCRIFTCKSANSSVWKRLHKRTIPFPYAFPFSEEICSCIRCQETSDECILFEPEWLCNAREGPLAFMALNETGACFPLHAETEDLCIMQVVGQSKIITIPRGTGLSLYGLNLITNPKDPHWRHVDGCEFQKQFDWSTYDVPKEEYELSPGDGLHIPGGICYYFESLNSDCIIALVAATR